MAYTTLDNLKTLVSEDTLLELTDDSDAGEIDTGKISAAIADADAEIDPYCHNCYAVPFDPVPEIIRKLSGDIAVYNLYARRHEVPETWQKRYDAALEFLRGVALQKYNIAGAETLFEENLPLVVGSERVFSRAALREY